MMKEESAVKDIDLEFVEIAEFIRSDSRKEILRYKEQERRRKRNLYRMLVIFIVVFLSAVLLGAFAFHLSLMLIGTILVLEAAIAVCFYHASPWVHVLEILIGIGAGVVFGELPFMVVGALVYLGAILAWTGVENFIFWQ